MLPPFSPPSLGVLMPPPLCSNPLRSTGPERGWSSLTPVSGGEMHLMLHIPPTASGAELTALESRLREAMWGSALTLVLHLLI